MKPNLKWAALAVGCAGIVAAAFAGGRAWAGGIPTAGALNYSGLLQDASGAPLSGTQYIEVRFWNDATASAAVNLLCDTMTPTAIGLSNGRFSITLPDKCTTSVGSNNGIWAEVVVGPTANVAASLGRAKIGAVPFAVEANHAVNADHVAVITNWTSDPSVKLIGLSDGVELNNQTTFSSWRRVGDSIEMQITTNFQGAPTKGAGGLAWTLPTGVSNDESKLDRTKNVAIGVGVYSPSLSTACVPYTAGARIVLQCGTAGPIGSSGLTVGAFVQLRITLPVVGWGA